MDLGRVFLATRFPINGYNALTLHGCCICYRGGSTVGQTRWEKPMNYSGLAALIGIFAMLCGLNATAEVVRFEISGTVISQADANSRNPARPLNGFFEVNTGAPVADANPVVDAARFIGARESTHPAYVPSPPYELLGESNPEFLDSFGLEIGSGYFSLRTQEPQATRRELVIELESGADQDRLSLSFAVFGRNVTDTQVLRLELLGDGGSLWAGSDTPLEHLSALERLAGADLSGLQGTGTVGVSRSSPFNSFFVTIDSVSVSLQPNLSAATLISANLSGRGPNGTSWDPTLAADGSLVAFSSDATDLAATDPNGSVRDVFLRDLASGEVVNVTSGANGPSEDPVLSKDGRWLTFVTRATNLPTDVADTNGEITDIVLYEVATGAMTLVTSGADGDSSAPSLSRDGSRLVFDSYATTFPPNNHKPFGCTPIPVSNRPRCYKHVIYFERDTGRKVTLSQGAESDSHLARINEAGGEVAFVSGSFQSSSDLLADSETPGIIVINLDSGVYRFSRIFGNHRPIISASGRWVAAGANSIQLRDMALDVDPVTIAENSGLPGEFSSDETRIVYSSVTSDRLLPDPNGSERDIYALDLTALPNLVETRLTFGGNALSGGPVTNTNGTLLVFDSPASNFSDDNNGELYDVFLLNIPATTVEQPAANPQELSIVAGESLLIELTGIDPAGETLMFELISEPTQGTLQGTPPDLTYTAAADASGRDSFEFRVSSNGRFSDSALVGIEVQPASCAPECAAPVAAVLPASRAMLMNSTATVFATVLNPADTSALACRIELDTTLDIDFEYRSADPLTNIVSGEPNPAVDIPPQGASSFVLALTPRESFTLTQLEFNFICGNSGSASVAPGINTLSLSSSIEPIADVVAIALTPSENGIAAVGTTNFGVYAVATVNLGADAIITASPATGSWFSGDALICETQPVTGECLAPPASSVETSMNALSTASFGVFVRSDAAIALDPASNRQTVQFVDSSGNTRGSTSVALTTAP